MCKQMLVNHSWTEYDGCSKFLNESWRKSRWQWRRRIFDTTISVFTLRHDKTFDTNTSTSRRFLIYTAAASLSNGFPPLILETIPSCLKNRFLFWSHINQIFGCDGFKHSKKMLFYVAMECIQTETSWLGTIFSTTPILWSDKQVLALRNKLY